MTVAGQRTVDLIVPWNDVRKGDLVVHYGRLVIVNGTKHASADDPARTLVMLDGRWFRPRRYSITAVRRPVADGSEPQ